ncbi:pro-MCH [Cololabis saira]|uniref:pro-MCH n=1 Tax=Cololabis saira TaxID=129043 RepID=UPI002AD27FEB|nr:pro-MCH [Cololabis saira]
MISICSILVTIVLFSEMNRHLAVEALSSSKLEDGATEQEGLDSLLADELMADPTWVRPMERRYFALDDNVRDDENPKFIVLSDTRLKGHRVRGLNPVFTRGRPLLADQSSSRTPGDFSLKMDRRDTDLDMLRCMIGRVYRPCWEA